MKLYPKKLEAWHVVLLIVGTVAGMLYATTVFTWDHFAKPEVKCMIDQKVDPIVDKINDALEYNNCLHMSSMSDEQLKKADELYKQCRLAKGMRGRP
jgi:hypothetical protein